MAYDTSKLASLQALKDTATRIKKEYLAAISKAGHASFQKAEAIPTAEEAQENILYLVKNTETGHYDIYALVDGAVELLDDTTVNLDGCVTDEELATALAGLGGGALYEGTKSDLSASDSSVIEAYFTEHTDITPKSGDVFVVTTIVGDKEYEKSAYLNDELFHKLDYADYSNLFDQISGITDWENEAYGGSNKQYMKKGGNADGIEA